MLNPKNSEQSQIENPDPESANPSTDLTQGYCVKLYVYGDGSYGVGEPEAITPEEDGEEEGHIADLTSALKRILNVVKRNPVGSDEDAQFDAGYNPGAQ